MIFKPQRMLLTRVIAAGCTEKVLALYNRQLAKDTRPYWGWIPKLTCSSESSALVPWFTGKGIRPSTTKKPGESIFYARVLATVLVQPKGGVLDSSKYHCHSHKESLVIKQHAGKEVQVLVDNPSQASLTYK